MGQGAFAHAWGVGCHPGAHQQARSAPWLLMCPVAAALLRGPKGGAEEANIANVPGDQEGPERYKEYFMGWLEKLNRCATHV